MVSFLYLFIYFLEARYSIKTRKTHMLTKMLAFLDGRILSQRLLNYLQFLIMKMYCLKNQ